MNTGVVKNHLERVYKLLWGGEIEEDISNDAISVNLS